MYRVQIINIFAISTSLLSLSRDLAGVGDVSASRINQLRRRRGGGGSSETCDDVVLCLKDAQFYQ